MIRRIDMVKMASHFGNEYIYLVEYVWDSKVYMCRIAVPRSMDLQYLTNRIGSMIIREISKKIREQIREKLLENDEILKTEIMNKLTEE